MRDLDLDLTEQRHVRTVLRNLRLRTGTWTTIADGLRVAPKTLEAMLYGRTITASLAIRVARLMGASVDDLLAGRFLPGACPNCGFVPDETPHDGASQTTLAAPPRSI